MINNKKKFGDLYNWTYRKDSIYLINKNNGVITNGKYEGTGFVSPIHKNVLYFKIKDNPFIHMMNYPDGSLSSIEMGDFIITPSKTLAKELSRKYSKN